LAQSADVVEKSSDKKADAKQAEFLKSSLYIDFG
jgi:hypothetical protein